jgi:predicted nuclease with TOPRIM domain
MGLFSPDPLTRELTDEIIGLRADIATLTAKRKAIKEEFSLSATVLELREEISRLKVERSTIEEEYERQEREVRHEVGLLKKQTEAETEIARKEAVLEVREENLDADRTRFEEQMRFTTKRFEEEGKYTRELMTEILKRLPTVTVDRKITEGTPAPAEEAA